MSISVCEDLIGKKVCYLSRNIVSRDVVCKTHTVTAYMVLKEQNRLRTKVRLDNGKWEYASNLFYPQDETAARARFVEKFGN